MVFEMKKKIKLINVQNMSVNDGDGLRTNVFFYGCPLRCRWCANPESFVDPNKAKVDMTDDYELDELVEKIERQGIFFRFSGGGVTFSGGEPTYKDMDLVYELAKKLYDDGYSLAIETSGYFDYDKTKPLLDLMETIFVDIKVMDEDKHKNFTGVSNKIILENIKKIAKTHFGPNSKKEVKDSINHKRCVGNTKRPPKHDGNELCNVELYDKHRDVSKSYTDLVIRIPLIVGVNEDEENIEKLGKFLGEIGNVKLEILPYHRFGIDKYNKLGLKPPSEDFDIPSNERIAEVEEKLKSYGIEIVSYK